MSETNINVNTGESPSFEQPHAEGQQPSISTEPRDEQAPQRDVAENQPDGPPLFPSKAGQTAAPDASNEASAEQDKPEADPQQVDQGQSSTEESHDPNQGSGGAVETREVAPLGEGTPVGESFQS